MNKDKRNNIQLLGTLNNADESGIIANANQIYDANEDKSTQDVSKEHTERIKTLEDKEDSMQTTLENITKTGEASAASNVTYNHSDSKLDATNVQQAVDEVRKRSNYNDGDNIIDFNTIHIITDNPEFAIVAVDVNNRILYGIKADGQPYFGVGCPQQVKDYIDEQINNILGTDDITATIDSLKEIEAFLKDFTNSDTLKKLLDLKANVDEVRATTDDIYKKSNPNDSEGNVVDTNTIVSIENNPEYIKALTDSVGKLIEAIGIDGIRKFFTGINIQGTLQCVTDNPEYIAAWLDNQNRIVLGFKTNGDAYFGYGIPSQIKTIFDAINSKVEKIEKIHNGIYLGGDIYPSDVLNIKETNEDIVGAFVDALNRIIAYFGKDAVFNLLGGLNVQGNTFGVMDSNEYISVLADRKNRILASINNKGEVDIPLLQVNSVIKKEIQSEVAELNDALRNVISGISTHNILTGKKYAYCGDSYTSGASTYHGVGKNGLTKEDVYDDKLKTYKSYGWWICHNNGMIAYPDGRDGSRMSYVLSDSKSPEKVELYNNMVFSGTRYRNIPADTDYCTLAFGLNEASNKKVAKYLPYGLEDIEANYKTVDTIGDKESTDLTTIWGAWNTVLSYILTNHPYMHIGIIIFDNWLGGTETSEAEKEIAKYWGIPYLDFYNDNKIPFFWSKGYNTSSVLKELTETRFNSNKDNHPNIYAHKYLATIIENFIRTL